MEPLPVKSSFINAGITQEISIVAGYTPIKKHKIPHNTTKTLRNEETKIDQNLLFTYKNEFLKSQYSPKKDLENKSVVMPKPNVENINAEKEPTSPSITRIYRLSLKNSEYSRF